MVDIKIHYGPYEACGIVKHRTQRLFGLTEQLKLLGHRVELVPSKHWDRVQIEIAERIIFTCRLTFFEYNCECKHDPQCCKAVAAVNEAITRILSGRTLETEHLLSHTGTDYDEIHRMERLTESEDSAMYIPRAFEYSYIQSLPTSVPNIQSLPKSVPKKTRKMLPKGIDIPPITQKLPTDYDINEIIYSSIHAKTRPESALANILRSLPYIGNEAALIELKHAFPPYTNSIPSHEVLYKLIEEVLLIKNTMEPIPEEPTKL